MPPPLRFSRFRALRHWTIQRAASLLKQKDRLARQGQLEKQYNSMRAAMEEMRTGLEDGGRLFRQASDRHGVYGGPLKEKDIVGNGGVPLEYARAQTDGPAKEGWDENWTRME